MLEKVGLEHSSKSTKYELEGSYGDPVHEHLSVLKTAKLPRECNETRILKIHKTGRREAVRSIVECKSHQKNMPDSSVTLPWPRNAENN